jgi:hypothetical protein
MTVSRLRHRAIVDFDSTGSLAGMLNSRLNWSAMKMSSSLAPARALLRVRWPIAAFCALLTFWTGGCSSFERAWQAAEPSPFDTNSMAGRWEGTWRSEVNGHHDRLRCLMTPSTNGVYAARFHAHYKRGIRFTYSYTVPLTVTNGPSPDTFQFHGAASLGWYAGGTYSYAGVASPTNFFSTYESKYDHGTFEMTRPRSPK